MEDPFLDATIFCTPMEGKRIKRCSTPTLKEESKELEENPILRLDSMTLDDGWNSIIPEINEGTISNSSQSVNSNSDPLTAHLWNSNSSECTELHSFEWDKESPPISDAKEHFFMSQHELGLGSKFQSQGNLKNRIQSFNHRLEQVHIAIKNHILNHVPELEQGHYISLVSNWAQELAASPLGTNDIMNIEKS
jgi:hypothetical protein